MGKAIIEVRNLSKRYRLGELGASSLRDEVRNLWQRMRGRSRPGRENAPADFWALRDVSFTVQPGEVVGIIGRNGAGKSTLLKILSRITQQTSGEITLRGRVASLLEVGTGFHPELSGRENVYLNGAILGMTRAEIRRKFDEIVAFAEVEKFIDTPVKRYSSGMYVRLAFAVAAHLEPEILVVDEVLAVGDQAFQQKCLGKMNDVAHSEGRTVLFVSHNMAAVARLCGRIVHLEAGRVAGVGAASDIVEKYLDRMTALKNVWVRETAVPVSRKASLVRVAIVAEDGAPAKVLPHSSPITIELDCVEHATDVPWVLRVSLYDRHGHELFSTHDTEALIRRYPHAGQTLRAQCRFAGGLLRPGVYSIGVSACELAGNAPVALYEEIEPVVAFEVSPENYTGQAGRGLLGPKADWKFSWHSGARHRA